MENVSTTFKPGENVVWFSKSRGVGTVYYGKVVGIVPAGSSLKNEFWTVFDSIVPSDTPCRGGLYRPVKHALGIGIKKEIQPRKYESYIVRALGQYSVLQDSNPTAPIAFRVEPNEMFYFPSVESLFSTQDGIPGLVKFLGVMYPAFGMKMPSVKSILPPWMLPDDFKSVEEEEMRDCGDMNFMSSLAFRSGSWDRTKMSEYDKLTGNTSPESEDEALREKAIKEERYYKEREMEEARRGEGGSGFALILIAVIAAVVLRYFHVI